MPQRSTNETIIGHRYALCVGIGQYTQLHNRNLRYAVIDATTLAERLADPQRGNFAVTLLTEPAQTSEIALEEALDELLNAPDRQAEDLVVLYFSCHGDVYAPDSTFCLLPSNAAEQTDGTFKRTTLIGIYDLAKALSGARVHNIVVLLDVCHSGGAGVALQHLKLDLSAGPNLFVIGAAREDQVTMQSSQLQHGLFTHCLLRAFEQPPTKDGWLTISQIHTFVSDDIQWFIKEHPIQIQGWSVSVNPNLPLLRNPAYPELCPLPPLWNVPWSRNPFFLGREDVLTRLATMLQGEQKTALTQLHAISGMGGIGKTQLALEYAYRHRQNYHAVFWGHANTKEALISTFVSIAHLLDLTQKDEQDQMIAVEAVKAWLAERSQWLLILDNADELVLIKEYLPPAFQGHVLLTTRAQAMGGVARKLEVEVMQPEIGALFLMRRAGLLAPETPLEEADTTKVTAAKELSEELGGLPLALDQSGAYIEETECSLTQYLQSYRTRRATLLKRRGRVGTDHPDSVATTWSLSFEKVEHSNPAAAELLRLCAFLSPDTIPEEIITVGAASLDTLLHSLATEPGLLDEAISTLRVYSLLRRDPEMSMLSIHRLIQAVLRDAMTEQERAAWRQRAIQVLNAVFPEVTFKAWKQCERLTPHVLMYATFTTDQAHEQELASLLRKAADYLYERARYEQAESLYQRALHIWEQALGAEHHNVATTLDGLANIYKFQGKYEQAELM